MSGGLTLSDWTGLVTSTGILATFALSLYVWLRYNRPSRRLEAGLGEQGAFILVTFTNERGPDVVLTEVGFECIDGTLRARHADGGLHASFSEMYHSPHLGYSGRLPQGLAAGQSLTFSFRQQRWLHNIREEGHPFPIRAYCRDATGKLYKSSSLRWDVTCALRGDAVT